MSFSAELSATSMLRALNARRPPPRVAVPVAVGVVGVVLLLVGGAAAFFGGWWMATAFPIAVGGFWRPSWMAAIPAGFWLLWGTLGSAVGIAHTPGFVALFLAIVAAGATLLAQFSVFPATHPEAGPEPLHLHTGPGVLEDAADLEAQLAHVDPPAGSGEDELDPELLSVFEQTAEFTAIDAGVAYEAATGDAPVVSGEALDLPSVDAADATERSEAREQPAGLTNDAAIAALVDDEVARLADGAPTAVPYASDLTPVRELPVDAPDPSPLDEGGHVTEFAAITEDLFDLAAASDQSTDDAAPEPGAGD